MSVVVVVVVVMVIEIFVGIQLQLVRQEKIIILLVGLMNHRRSSSMTATSASASSSLFGGVSATAGFTGGFSGGTAKQMAVSRQPEMNKDEMAINALMQWLGTSVGQQYLSELSVHARTMYSSELWGLAVLLTVFYVLCPPDL